MAFRDLHPPTADKSLRNFLIWSPNFKRPSLMQYPDQLFDLLARCNLIVLPTFWRNQPASFSHVCTKAHLCVVHMSTLDSGPSISETEREVSVYSTKTCDL